MVVNSDVDYDRKILFADCSKTISEISEIEKNFKYKYKNTQYFKRKKLLYILIKL